jgi:hypothetical protein
MGKAQHKLVDLMLIWDDLGSFCNVYHIQSLIYVLVRCILTSTELQNSDGSDSN